VGTGDSLARSYFLHAPLHGREQDILAHPAPKRRRRLTSRRIGIHTSTAGGIHNAAERAYRLGCNTLQIFLLQFRASGRRTN